MGKVKFKKGKDNEIIAEIKEEKTFEIISAKINDDYCEYSYEVKSGVGVGDTVTVKNNKTKLIDEDMRIAFYKFNVHLAIIDDVFKHSNIQIDALKPFHNHELTGMFTVTGFKIKGSEENEAIILTGYKQVNVGGIMDLETPKIELSQLSGYPWYNELKEAADEARNEVELYMGGKFELSEKEEKPNPKQLKITDNMGDDLDMDKA